MSQLSIPCLFMRAGTSRGPFFLAGDLPANREELSTVLLGVMGSPDSRQIDGLGGAKTVTSKVAIVSASEHPDADVDFLFAQVDIERAIVDWSPTCGNMLAGVLPFAVERGLVEAGQETTSAVVRNVNTDSFIDVTVQTPGGAMTYAGDTHISGVPGTGSPIDLMMREIVGSKTGSMLPTGNVVDGFNGIDATCVDVSVPLVVTRATDFGLTGYESPAAIDGNADFMERMESVRRSAGAAMGLGDVSESVVPRFALVSPPLDGGHLSSRYLTPTQGHPAYAVSGSTALASSALIAGSIAEEFVVPDARLPGRVEIEHPSGSIEVRLDVDVSRQPPVIRAGGTVRTARPLMDGNVFVAGL